MKARVATIHNSNTWAHILNITKEILSKNELKKNISNIHSISLSEEPLGQFEEIGHYLDSGSENCLFLVFDPLETVISLAFKINENVDDAAKHFCNDLEQLYKFKTKYKNRLKILDSKQTLNNPSASLNELLPVDYIQKDQIPHIDIYDIFAVYYIASIDNLKSMSSKFSIISSNAYENSSNQLLGVIDRLSEELFSNKENTELELESLINVNGELKLDKRLALEQLKQVQAELEHYFKKYTFVSDDANKVKIINEKLEADLRKKRRHLRNIDAKLNELILKNDKLVTANKSELSRVCELNEFLSQENQQLIQHTKNQESLLIESRSSRRRISKLNDRLEYNLALAENKILLLSAEHYSSKEKSRLLHYSPFVRLLNKLTSKMSKSKETKFIARIENIWLIENSELFDEEWYLNRYSEVAESRVSPAEHYLDIGENAGYFPSKKFDPIWYCTRYPDIQSANFGALLHYIRYGFSEGRLPKSS